MYIIYNCLLGSLLYISVQSTPIFNGQSISASNSSWSVIVRGIDSIGWWITCGGTLISEITVLTAAHCYHIGNNYNVYVGGVRTDGTDALDEIPVKRYAQHPYYNNAKLEYDVGILRLERPVVQSELVKAIAWNRDANLPRLSDKLQIVGNGRNSVNDLAPLRQSVFAKSVNFSVCKNWFSFVPSNEDQGNICVKHTEGTGTCLGDSGSGLVLEKRLVVGVFVLGAKVCGKLGNIAMYTRLSSVRDWIDSEMART